MKKILTGIMTLALTTSLFAKKGIDIGSGGEGGNYYTVASDMVEYCGKDIQDKYGYEVKNIASHGSVDNLNGILNKKYSIGFVQEDVLNYFKKKDQLNTIELNTKRLMYLYPEYLTILIPKGWHPKSNGGFFSRLKFWDKPQNKPISIMSLKGQTVYAQGGALVSAQALSYFMGLKLNIQDASKGHVSGPFIFVTGSGDQRIQKMLASGKWFLLSFNGNELANRAAFYKPSQVTYIVNGKTITAKTVSIMSLVLERNYRSKKRKEALKALKMCVKSNIDDLVDDGESNKWSLIQKINGWNGGGDDE